jgi:tetratricopeptide (TPR) repeat protein
MRKYFVIVLIFLLSSCYSLKQKRVSLSAKDLNSSDFIEYNYNYTEGTKQKLLGNKNQAILCFIRCIELNPKSSGALFQLSEIYSSTGNIQKAILFAKKAYTLDSRNQWYLLELAKLYQNANVIDSSIYFYNKLIKLSPAKEEYYLTTAYLYFKNNNPKVAIKVLNSFVDKFGLTEDITITLYQIYKYINDNNSCLQLLHLANIKFPDEPRFYGLLAEHFMSVQQMDSALYYYNKLLTVDPGNDKGIFSLIEYYKANYDTVNVRKYFVNFIENPKNDLSDKCELLSSFINDSKYRSKFSNELPFCIDSLIENNGKNEKLYILKTDLFLRNNDLTHAKTTLIYLVTNFRANYIIWEQLLFTLNTLSQYTDLLEYAKQANQLFSDKPLPYLFQGMAYFYTKNFNEAIDVLNKGLKYVTQSRDLSIQFHTYLGESYHSIKDFTNSDYNFERALQFDPQNVMVLNNYSYYLALRNEQLEKALNYIQVCVSKFPNSSTYLDTYGWILYKKGNFRDAKLTIEKALQNGGSGNMDIIEHYSEILYYNGDKTNAIKFYKILEENGKSNLTLKKLLQIE